MNMAPVINFAHLEWLLVHSIDKSKHSPSERHTQYIKSYWDAAMQ